MKVIIFLISVAIVIASISATSSPSQDTGKKVVCYFGSWAVYRYGNGLFDVPDIDPMICTHLIYGFAGINTNHTLRILDEYLDLETNWGRGAMRSFTNLKQQNPALKTLLAIGGWNEGSANYSSMAATAAGRRTFIDSVVPFVQLYNFDGFDLDWEYPTERGGNPEDRDNFALLCQEMRAEFDKYGLLLTAAVSAGSPTVEKAYDVPSISRSLHFINIMVYDFHGGWETTTHHHSPLERHPQDTANYSTYNMKDAVNFWISKGADPAKLILGMGSYGRGWVLDDPNVNGVYAPASQLIDAGPYTGEAGMWGYNEILQKFAAQPGQWTTVRQENLKAPYSYNGKQWIAYDDPESITLRSQYAMEIGLGGVMFWSIETDDFHGLFSPEAYPLIKAAYRVVIGGTIPPPLPTTVPPSTTIDYSASTTGGSTAKPPPPDGICTVAGNNPDAVDCQIFHVCTPDGDSWDYVTFTCPAGTIYDPSAQACDWFDNVDGAADLCRCDSTPC